ncbi:hypothetical protein ACJX0J_035301, partial [Zea mays]
MPPTWGQEACYLVIWYSPQVRLGATCRALPFTSHEGQIKYVMHYQKQQKCPYLLCLYKEGGATNIIVILCFQLIWLQMSYMSNWIEGCVFFTFVVLTTLFSLFPAKFTTLVQGGFPLLSLALHQSILLISIMFYLDITCLTCLMHHWVTHTIHSASM